MHYKYCTNIHQQYLLISVIIRQYIHMHLENCSYMILNAFTAVAKLDLRWILV